MEVKIKVTTPKGAAKGFSYTKGEAHMQFIRKCMLLGSKIKEEYINEEGSEIYWLVEVHSRKYPRLIKSVTMFDQIVHNTFNNRLVNHGIKKMADSEEDYLEMKEMISDGTKVEIITNATANELIEANNTFWQNIKEKFIKKS